MPPEEPDLKTGKHMKECVSKSEGILVHATNNLDYSQSNAWLITGFK